VQDAVAIAVKVSLIHLNKSANVAGGSTVGKITVQTVEIRIGD